MNNSELSKFDIYLLKESLKQYNELLSKEDSPKNSVVTKEYFEITITQLEEKLNNTTINKVRRLNATT